jgi:hypothetical protein
MRKLPTSSSSSAVLIFNSHTRFSQISLFFLFLPSFCRYRAIDIFQLKDILNEILLHCELLVMLTIRLNYLESYQISLSLSLSLLSLIKTNYILHTIFCFVHDAMNEMRLKGEKKIIHGNGNFVFVCYFAIFSSFLLDFSSLSTSPQRCT